MHIISNSLKNTTSLGQTAAEGGLFAKKEENFRRKSANIFFLCYDVKVTV